MTHENQFESTVMMGVGGSLEVFAGAKKRAPYIFRKLNIEWIYRALIDWKRIGRLKSIPIFMYKIAKTKKKNKKGEIIMMTKIKPRKSLNGDSRFFSVYLITKRDSSSLFLNSFCSAFDLFF